jgi:hypothetical protein
MWTTTTSVVFVPVMSRGIQRVSWVLVAAALICVVGKIAFTWLQANAREASNFRECYAAMRVALSADHSNAPLSINEMPREFFSLLP